jgi:hypothetical protein
VIEFAPLIAGAVIVVVLSRAVMRRRYERAATRNVLRLMELREGSAATVDPSGKAVVAVSGLIGVEAESESRGPGATPAPAIKRALQGHSRLHLPARDAEPVHVGCRPGFCACLLSTPPRELGKDDVT